MNSPLHVALTQPIAIRPGAPLGQSVHSPRRAVAQMLAERTPIDQLPRVLALAFNLCGHAHTLAATLALRAAGADVPPMWGAAESLRRETFLEHLRRMHLDWPRLLSPPQHADARQMTAIHAVSASPLRISASDDYAFWTQARQWLHTQWLGMTPADWLARWDADPQAWLREWARERPLWLAQCLHHAQQFDTDMSDAPGALDEHPPLDALAQFGDEVLQQPALALQPTWQGQCKHTGTWARSCTGASLTASHMLASRLAESVRLALGNVSLGADAQAWRPGRALVCVQMARGRLMHVVECEPMPASAQPRVLNYRVVAPTEWNFHPRGALAQAVSALPPLHEAPHDTRLKAQVLMAAFDPCVAFELQAGQPAPVDAQPCMN